MRNRVEESAQTSARVASIWKNIPPPGSDELVTTMRLNLDVQWIALDHYISHLASVHGRLLTRQEMTASR